MACMCRLPAGKKVCNGFSRKALHGWWPYLRVGLPSMAMICLGWWPTEALTLVRGFVVVASLLTCVRNCKVRERVSKADTSACVMQQHIPACVDEHAVYVYVIMCRLHPC